MQRMALLAIVLIACTARADDPRPTESATAPAEPGPFLLVPSTAPGTDSSISDNDRDGDKSNENESSLSSEVERLKQEQESLRNLLTGTPSGESIEISPHSESAKQLRSQL